MHHSFFDKYSDLKSPIHSLNPRAKFVCCAMVLACVVSTPPERSLAIISQFILILLMVFISQVPIKHFIKRILLIVPLALVVSGSLFLSGRASQHSTVFAELSFTILKVVCAITMLTIFSSTTSYQKILSAMLSFRVPPLVVSLLYFLYMFIYVAVDEFEKLVMGRQSRDLGSKRLLAWKSRAWMLGTFLIRSIERSEQTYLAMLARGFDGRTPCCNGASALKFSDLSSAVIVSTVFIFIRFGVVS